MSVVSIEQLVEKKDENKEDEESNTTVDLGCKNAFMNGRCLKGDKYENCIYEEFSHATT